MSFVSKVFWTCNHSNTITGQRISLKRNSTSTDLTWFADRRLYWAARHKTCDSWEREVFSNRQPTAYNKRNFNLRASLNRLHRDYTRWLWIDDDILKLWSTRKRILSQDKNVMFQDFFPSFHVTFLELKGISFLHIPTSKSLKLWLLTRQFYRNEL